MCFSSKIFFKYLYLWIIGGAIYYSLELIWRGYSHWTMIFLGGVCFICIGLLNEFLSWDTPLWKQMLLGMCIILILEFITGCIVNLWLKMDVWDYSNLPSCLHLLGQVCLPFAIVWFFISGIAIVLDDYVRYIFFDEEKPHYKFFKKSAC